MGLNALILTGPASGFVAYRFPGAQLDKDDSFALSGSEASLQEGGMAFRLNRVRRANGSLCTRFAGFKQTYEPNLQRPGHSLGVILEYIDAVADTRKSIATICAIMALVEENCVQNSRFCDDKQFSAFVHGALQQVLGADAANLWAGLPDAPGRPMAYYPSSEYQSETYFVTLDSIGWEDRLATLWCWQVYSPGGCLVESLVCARKGEAFAGSMSPPLPDIQKMDVDAAHALADQLDLNIKALSVSLASNSSFREEIGQYKISLREHEDIISQQCSTISSLQKRLDEKYAIRQRVLSESDLQQVRVVVAEGVQDGLRSSSRNLHPSVQPSKPTSANAFVRNRHDSIWDNPIVFWGCIASLVILMGALGALGYKITFPSDQVTKQVRVPKLPPDDVEKSSL